MGRTVCFFSEANLLSAQVIQHHLDLLSVLDAPMEKKAKDRQEII